MHDRGVNTFSLIQKEKLASALKNAGISEEDCEVFINLIYDETEENQEEISKEKFQEKYRLLLRLIEKDNDPNELENENSDYDNYEVCEIRENSRGINLQRQEAEDEKESIKIKAFDNESREVNSDFNKLSVYDKADEQSEILHTNKSNELINEGDTSIDLFNNLNFDEFEFADYKTSNPRKVNKDDNNKHKYNLSVVKPINTFKLNLANQETEFKPEKKKLSANKILEDIKHVSHHNSNEKKFSNQNAFLSSGSSNGNYFNYVQNVTNININNFDGMVSRQMNNTYRTNSIGNIKPLNDKLSMSSSNLNKKIQEVYKALNGIGERKNFPLEENEEFSADDSKIKEEIELNKLKRNLLNSQDLDDENILLNENLKIISNRINQKEKQKTFIRLGSLHNNQQFPLSNTNPSLNLNALNKRKFLDLRKLLRNGDNILNFENFEISNLNENPSNTFRRRSEYEKYNIPNMNNVNSFDEIENQIEKLKKKNLASKKKNSIGINNFFNGDVLITSQGKSPNSEISQNRKIEGEKLQNLSNVNMKWNNNKQSETIHIVEPLQEQVNDNRLDAESTLKEN